MPKYWSFSNSPSNEYSGLISFRIDGFDLLDKAANQCSKSWGEQGLGQPSPGGAKRSNGKGGIQGPGGRARGGEAHSRAPAATANRRVTHPAQGATEPLLWVTSFVGYCPIFLRSWWPLAPPAKLASSSWKVSCPTFCGDPEFTQTHVHRVSDAIQPSHPLSSPSSPAPSSSQHQSPQQNFQESKCWELILKNA